MSSELGRMNTADWDKLQDHADRFERAARAGTSADLRDFLPPPEDPIRLRCLHELIKVDLEIRWRKGRPTVLEDYQEKFSELGPARALPASLIFEEYLVRHRHGDRPALSAYRQRFPEQYESLARRVAEQDIPTGRPAATPVPPSVPSPVPVPPPAPSALPPAMSGPRIGSLVLGEGTVLPSGHQLIKRIGIGGFGEVWRAMAPGGVPTAIKIIFRPIDHEAARHELDSLELIKGLRHHFLLKTQAFWALEDRLVIAMDLADGSLRDRLKCCVKEEGGRGLPVEELLLYIRETAEALDYLHGKGVLHRDVKPENILLAEGHVRLADFGLARLHQSIRAASATGSGTPLYMAPEVWREKISRNSDQYSLAVTYFELRVGRRLFANSTLVALMTSHLEDTPDLSPLSEEEQQVLLRALSKDPAGRFPSCREFVAALEGAIRGETRKQAATQSAPAALATQSPPMTPPSWNADTDWNTIKPGSGGPPQGGPRVPPVADTERDVSQPQWHPKLPPPPPLPRWPLAVLLVLVAAGAGWWLATRGETDPVQVQLKPPPPPPPPPSVLPAPCPAGTFQPVAGAPPKNVGGKDYPAEIDLVLNDKTKVRFVLVYNKPESPRAPNTGPFYIMQDKVSNDLFARFDTACPGAVREPHWRLGGRARGRGAAAADPRVWTGATPAWPEMHHWLYLYLDGLEERRDAREYLPHIDDVGSGDGQLPVLRVGVEDAHRFAAWFGGMLPSQQEWEVAAGRWEAKRGDGPFEGPWNDDDPEGKFAVGRREKGPMPVGTAERDRSLFGCRDMSGNGWEWTRTYTFNVDDPGEYLGAAPIPDSARFALRGNSYAANRPLLFERLDEGQPPRQPYRRGGSDWRESYYIGFRVVVRPAAGQ